MSRQILEMEAMTVCAESSFELELQLTLLEKEGWRRIGGRMLEVISINNFISAEFQQSVGRTRFIDIEHVATT